MSLTWPVVAAVLFGALLHASWNALIKSGRDLQLDTALIHLLGCGVGAVLVAIVGLPPAAALPWLTASVVIHIGYYITLVGAYRHGELGFAYPIMRGSAPLLNAAIIASYTIVDGLGVRTSGNALQYVALLFLVDGAPYFALVVWQRRAALAPSLAYMGARWPVALLGACASLGAYGITLWAMTKAPVASVAALRETSVLFAALIGVLVLKERFRFQRAVGTGAIIAGVMALRLAS